MGPEHKSWQQKHQELIYGPLKEGPAHWAQTRRPPTRERNLAPIWTTGLTAGKWIGKPGPTLWYLYNIKTGATYVEPAENSAYLWLKQYEQRRSDELKRRTERETTPHQSTKSEVSHNDTQKRRGPDQQERQGQNPERSHGAWGFRVAVHDVHRPP